MGTRISYSPGAFSWTDLTTPDQEGAKRFYGEMFGWEADDQPVGEGVYYSMMKLDGQNVAAISPQPPPQREAGWPPTWNSYITVESADAVLARAEELGGKVHAPAFDIFDVGRMGAAQDRQGAYFLVWEPKTHIGASVVNTPGSLTWNELATRDMDAAEAFYGELFGWTTEPLPHSEVPYRVIKNADGRTNGGMSSMGGADAPPSWLVYFGTEDTDAAVARVHELGGTTILEPMGIGPSGRVAVVRDPGGAVFALYSGRFED